MPVLGKQEPMYKSSWTMSAVRELKTDCLTVLLIPSVLITVPTLRMLECNANFVSNIKDVGWRLTDCMCFTIKIVAY